MYLMYVDESGDCGMPLQGSPSRLFCLTGVVVHELRWRETLSELTSFRHWLKGRYGVFTDDELHAGDLLAKPSRLPESLARLRKHERLAIVRHFADTIGRLRDIRVINVVIDKKFGKVPSKHEVFRRAWYTLFQRFENTIRQKNFPGPWSGDERGVVFADNTDGEKLRQFLDTMRIRNPLKVRQRSGAYRTVNDPVQVIIEHPVLRDSRESYFVQVADCVVHLLKQSIEPSTFMKRHGGNAYFQRLDAVLCKHASRQDPTGMGVVRL